MMTGVTGRVAITGEGEKKAQENDGD